MSISGLAGYGRPYPTWPDLAQTISGLAGSGPDHIWLEMAQTISGQAGYGRPYPARPDMDMSISGQTQPAGRRGWKKHLFWRVFLGFLSCFLLFHRQFVCEMPLLQKKSVRLTSSSRRSADYKVPPRIGGHHFLLCQYTNTKDIAGQSAT